MLRIRRSSQTFPSLLIRKRLGNACTQFRRVLHTRVEEKYGKQLFWSSVFVGSLGASLALFYSRRSLNAKSHSALQPYPTKSTLYSKEDVAEHNSLETGIWVTYQGHVYDITEFVSVHPGGDKILIASGGPLEPFWAIYAVHQNPGITKMLEKYRIGDLKAEDRKSLSDTKDPYVNDPDRHPSLIARSKKPFNAETPLSLLGDSMITPNSLFYVRNHLPVPDVDPKSYALEVNVEKGGKPLKLTLEDLKTKFKQHTVTVAIQCAGNRRDEMNAIKKVKGLTWSEGAIGNACWTGVKLRDILLHAGYSASEADHMKHVQFEGLDCDASKNPYGASIPLDKAMDPRRDVLVAFAMNGEDIPRDHGYPIRVVVPGVVGARQVKWLSKIIISDEESHSHWQRNDYKGFSPCTDWDTVDFKSAPSIQDLPVQSAICEPANGAVLEEGTDEFTVKGYAWSGGGRSVIRVDVSPDGGPVRTTPHGSSVTTQGNLSTRRKPAMFGRDKLDNTLLTCDQGKTWQIAELKKPQQPEGRSWGWTLWETTVSVNNRENFELCCKAVDSAYNSQPDSVAPIWNLRGVLSTAWHRVSVTVPPDQD